MLTIYHAPGTRSVRPIWLCYELGLEPVIEPVTFTPEYLASEEWRAISPAGKIPILKDGGLTMFESGAMMDYLLERYGEGRLRPAAGTDAYALHQQWCWFSESTLARPMGMMRLLRPPAEGESLPDIARSKILECLDVVEAALADSTYLLDEFTAADVMMAYSLELVLRFRLLGDAYPATSAYLEAMKARPACQRALSA